MTARDRLAYRYRCYTEGVPSVERQKQHLRETIERMIAEWGKHRIRKFKPGEKDDRSFKRS